MDTIYDQLLTISYNLGPKKFGSVSRIGQNLDRNRKLKMSKILNCIGHRRQNKLDMNFSSEVINKYHQGTVCTSLQSFSMIGLEIRYFESDKHQLWS